MRKTIYICIVLDPRFDMYSIGHDEEYDQPFYDAYCQCADKLQRMVNSRLGGHSVEIYVQWGSYDGPDMLDDDQPELYHGESLWQHLHNLIGDSCIDEDNGGTITFDWSEPSEKLVNALREWALDKIRNGE